MAAPLREIPRPPSSRINSRPTMLRVRAASPELEAYGFEDDLADPEDEPLTWSPMSWVADKASAAVDILKSAGEWIYNQSIAEAADVVATLNAALTGAAPGEPGPLYGIVTGAAERFNRMLPEQIQEKLGTSAKSNIAGYITLSDGTRIPVPKAEDNRAQGEKGLSDVLRASMLRTNAEAAADRARTRLEEQKLAVSADQWTQAFELKQRADARQQRMFELQERAAKQALDKQTVINRGPGWWNLPSRLSWEEEPPQRVVRTIGPGVAGGIQMDKSRWSTD